MTGDCVILTRPSGVISGLGSATRFGLFSWPWAAVACLSLLIKAGPGSMPGRLRLSSALALASDAALLVLGGNLKRQEKLSARLGDILAQLYIASAALKRFHDQGRPEEDEVLLDWVCQDGLFKAQEQLAGFLRNFPAPFLARALGLLIFPLGRRYHPPGDRLGGRMVGLFLEPTAARDRLTGGVFISTDDQDRLGRIEQAFQQQARVTDIEKKARQGLKGRGLKPANELELIDMALKEKIIDQNEERQLRVAYEAMLKAIAVDDF